MTQSVAVIILTLDEEIHLERAIRSVRPFAGSIHVVDSGSTDRTIAIAERLGAEVLRHPFRNQADQFQWALGAIGTDAEWILRLDADEIIEPDLADRISRELPTLGPDVTGVTFDRKHIFMGRWIRHGGRYPLTLLRLFRRGRGRIEQRWMDEHIVVDGGRTVHFAGGFADHNLNDLSFFTDKHNRYATREAVDVLNRRHRLFARDVDLESNAGQASAKRRVKEGFYNAIPFPVSTLAYFLYRYIVRLGFLDGREGLIYHVLQGYWYRFLVGARTLELERAIAHLPDAASKLRELSRRTGLALEAESPQREPAPETHVSTPAGV
jgi:glycosyltransferase involved in cell wall biosynthesis